MGDNIRVSSPLSDKEREVRHKLRRYMSLVSEYNARKELYNTLFPRQTSMIRDVPISCNNGETELDRVVDRRLDMSARMDRSLQTKRQEIDEIMSMVEGLPALESAVLIRRYALGQSFEAIGAEINYCRRQIYNIHDRAITRIAERVHNIAQENMLY